MRIVVTGASGQLGTYVLDELAGQGHQVEAWTHRAPVAGSAEGGTRALAVDLVNAEALALAFSAAQPEAVLHLAAISKPALVLEQPEAARLTNVVATESLSRLCEAQGARLVFTSTDMVFDGRHAPYREAAEPAPANAYGRTKALGEAIVSANPRGLVVRIPLLYGPTRCQRPTFYDHSVAALGRGERQLFFHDEYRTPLDLLTAARLLIRLLCLDATGTIHLGGPERLSRLELMTRVARTLELDTSLVAGNSLASAPAPEPRPADTSMISDRISELVPEIVRPGVEQAVRAMHAAL